MEPYGRGMAILNEKDRKDFVKLFEEYLRVENLNHEAAKRYITASLKREHPIQNVFQIFPNIKAMAFGTTNIAH
jgi:hypothetical protein